MKIKNIFILFIIPLISFKKPFTFKVLPHQSGKANKKTLITIKDRIKELFDDDLPVDLQYIAVDGDPGYNNDFDNEFGEIFGHFCKFGFDGLIEKIEEMKKKYKSEKLCLFLTDMVHFLKNRRTEIIINDLFLNGNKIHVECLEEVLFQSSSITDKSSLSKLQDQFPIEIFNCQILSFLLNCRNDDLTFFALPIVFWNEAFNNSIIDKSTRLFLMECSICGFKKFYEIQNKLKKKMK